MHFLPMRFLNLILELLSSYFQFRFIYPALEDCSLPDSPPKELRPPQKLFLAQLPDNMLECVLDFLPYWEDSFARTCKHWKGLSLLHQTHLIRSSPLFRSFEPENMVPLDSGTLSLLQIKFNWSELEKSKFWSTSLLATLAAHRIRSPYANEITCRLFKECVKFGGFGKELLRSVILYGKETKNYELICLLLENGAKFPDFPDMFEFSNFILESNDCATEQDLKFVIESLKRAYRHNKDILLSIPLNRNSSSFMTVLLHVHASMDFDGSLLSHIGPQLDINLKIKMIHFLFDLDPSSLSETERKMVYDRNTRLLYQFISEFMNNVKADHQYLLLNEWRYGAYNVDENQLKNLNLFSILQLQCINTAIKTKKISVFGRRFFRYYPIHSASFPFNYADYPEFDCSRDTNSFWINFYGKDFADFLRDCYIVLNFSTSIKQDSLHNFREDDCVLSEYFNSLSLTQIEELIRYGKSSCPDAYVYIAIRFTDSIAIFKLALSKLTSLYRYVSYSTYSLVFKLLRKFRGEKDDLIEWLLVLFESIKAKLRTDDYPQTLSYENCKLDLILKLMSNSCVQDLIAKQIIRLDFSVSADQIFEGCIQTDRYFDEFTSQDMLMSRLDIFKLFSRSIYRFETIGAVERLAKIVELDKFRNHSTDFHSIPFLEQVKALFTGTNYELIICLAPVIGYWKAADFVHFEYNFPEEWKEVYNKYLESKN